MATKQRIPRAIYDYRGWVLGRCANCGRTHYVEPHGTTAKCACAGQVYTEHENIPYEFRNDAGTVMIRRWEG